MAKVATLLMIASLLFLCSSTLTYASRPEPCFVDATPGNTHRGDCAETEQVHAVDENCQGFGEEECLKRRTLAAHLDYIYTQKQKP